MLYILLSYLMVIVTLALGSKYLSRRGNARLSLKLYVHGYAMASPVRIILKPFTLFTIAVNKDTLSHLVDKYPPIPGSTVTFRQKDLAERYKDFITGGSTSGHYNRETKEITIFPRLKVEDMIDTYFHERRHAQQHIEMTEQFDISLELLSVQSMLFPNDYHRYYLASWHESDARRAGRIMAKRYIRLYL